MAARFNRGRISNVLIQRLEEGSLGGCQSPVFFAPGRGMISCIAKVWRFGPVMSALN